LTKEDPGSLLIVGSLESTEPWKTSKTRTCSLPGSSIIVASDPSRRIQLSISPCLESRKGITVRECYTISSTIFPRSESILRSSEIMIEDSEITGVAESKDIANEAALS
jgi:hypothetical protein